VMGRVILALGRGGRPPLRGARVVEAGGASARTAPPGMPRAIPPPAWRHPGPEKSGRRAPCRNPAARRQDFEGPHAPHAQKF